MEKIINPAGTLAEQIGFKPLTIPEGCLTDQDVYNKVGDVNLEQARLSGLPHYPSEEGFLYELSDVQKFFNLYQ